MAEARKCSRCGAELPAGAPGGHCPQCLLQLALAPEAETDPPAATTNLTPAAEVSAPEQPGDRIGRFKLLEKIGEGGYGIVYMAEQVEPLHRRVALKVIKLGMDTKQVIARFEAERQALALMDHPNIAKVLDAGTTDTGRPYFVMELVRGIKITDYCDRNSLSTRARLDLFIKICQAVQHAHQKGIIHRDLKPSNILVTELDGLAVPKVIDFGIAKATRQQWLTDKTLFTAFRQLIGTPAYMSPEQAGLSGVDTDTRSDIYALGVLLYELLTGHLPFDRKELLAAGLDEMRRLICEQEPVKPSTRLSSLAATDLTLVARKQHTEAPRLVHLVRGDLDWIVMKCLEKDRARRYETVSGLANDLGRHLNGEPVMAAAPGIAYRAGKFIRRHRYGFASATAIVLLLMAGAIASTWQAVRATKAEQQARTMSSFLEDMLQSVTPEEAKGRDTTLMLELLDKAAARMDQELKDQPLLKARLESTLGNVYLKLGQYPKAEPLLRQALEVRERTLGKEHPDTLGAINNLAVLLSDKGDYTAAEPLFRRVLEAQERTLGKEHPDTLGTVNNLALLLLNKGDYTAAEPLFRRALEARERRLGKEHPDTLTSINNLAALLSKKGDYTAVEPLFRQVLEAQERRLGKEHPETLGTVNNLAALLSDKRDYAAAEPLYRRVLEARERTLGKQHPDTLGSVVNLAHLLCDRGGEAGAEGVKLYRQAAEQNFAPAQNGVGFCYWAGQGVAKDEAEAVTWFRKAAEQNLAQAQCNLGGCYASGKGVAKDDVEAVTWYRKAAEQNHAEAQCNLGFYYWAGQGVARDYVEAVTWYRKAAEQNWAQAQHNLGVCYANGQGVAKDEVEAVRWYRKAAEQNHAEAQCNLGGCYANGQGVVKDEVEAVRWFRKAAEQNQAEAQCNLGSCYWAGQGVARDYVEAVRWYRKAAEQNHAGAQYNLGVCYARGQVVATDYVEAAKWYRKAAEQNLTEAQCNLGGCYASGQGVARDYVEAVMWYGKAAEQNNAVAQYDLAFYYVNGQGVAKDYVKGYKWILLALAQGFEPAKEAKAALEKVMTSQQIEAGQELARIFTSSSPSAVPVIAHASESNAASSFSITPASPAVPHVNDR